MARLAVRLILYTLHVIRRTWRGLPLVLLCTASSSFCVSTSDGTIEASAPAVRHVLICGCVTPRLHRGRRRTSNTACRKLQQCARPHARERPPRSQQQQRARRFASREAGRMAVAGAGVLAAARGCGAGGRLKRRRARLGEQCGGSPRGTTHTARATLRRLLERGLHGAGSHARRLP